MPEQAEWVGGNPVARPADTMPIVAHGGDDETDDYGHAWTVKPVPGFVGGDCRTYDQKAGERIQALETTVAMLVDEVQHLREDIARMRTGESQI